MNDIKDKIISIRLRTITVTLSIIVTLIFYFLVQVGFNKSVNIVDFIVLAFMQIMAHCLYFPDGELYGQKNSVFIANKTAYNEKATAVISGQLNERLKQFCEYDYNTKREKYIDIMCGKIGITIQTLNTLKSLSPKQIKSIRELKITAQNEQNETTLYLDSKKQKLLYKLLFCKIPIEYNSAEMILSATENNGFQAIKDISIIFKKQSYMSKIFKSVVIGGIFAWIGYNVKNGIGIAEITSICMYLTSLFSTAVTSYSSGQVCTEKYKNQFYIDLANYIDRFMEWNEKNKAGN